MRKIYTILKENDEPRKRVGLDTWHKAGYTGKGVNILVCDRNGKLYDFMKDYSILIDPEGIVKNTGDHNTFVTQICHESAPEAKIYVAPWTHSSKEIADWLRKNPNLIDIAGASLSSPISDAYDVFKELDIPFTVSSGNSYNKSRIGVDFPANLPWTIAVGAFNWNSRGVGSNDVLGYSNGGEDLDCVSLTNIYVQNETRKLMYTGTSTSRPFSTGMLACYIQWRKEHNLPKLGCLEMRKFVQENCVDIKAEGFDYDSGYGLFVMPKLEDIEKSLPKLSIPSPIQSDNKLTKPKYYRVQVGSFKSEINCEDYKKQLEQKGYKPYIIQVDGLFKLQMNAFSIQENCIEYSEQLKCEGIDNFIVYY